MEITVEHQDIVKSKSDAIVSPAGVGLEMSSGVARDIRDHSSEEIRADLQRYEPVSSGTAVVTRGYDIAEYLIHAVTTGQENTRAQNIRAATAASLERADRLACTDIAIPVLGTGKADLSIEAGVKIIGETIDAYRPTRLSTAQIVCKDRTKHDRAKQLCFQDGAWVSRSV